MGFSTRHGLVNAVTVRIWYPNKAANPVLSKFSDIGHASLTVKLNGVRHYITWQVAQGLPSLTEEHQALNYKTEDDYVPEGQMSKAKDESWMGSMTWGQMNGNTRGNYDNGIQTRARSQCDEKIRIKTQQPNGDGTGLDAGAIITWWDNRVRTETTYQLISKNKNCTGCVAEALKAGGLAGGPSSWFCVSASDLKVWVLRQIQAQNLQAEAGYE